MIEKELFPFLDAVYDPERPVLLAFSGGVDSLALFYALLDYAQKKDFFFAAAHVDHGWRKGSDKEARALEALCTENFVPFHLKTLDPGQVKGNLEEACRLERLDFFGQLSLEHDYQAVLLAHHADDMAEGVIKRMFEGAGLTKLSPMKRESAFEGLALWRPFLRVPKRKLQATIEAMGVQFVDDETNWDDKFLRGRLRTKLFPYLSEVFGKEVAKPLAEVAEESEELMEYFEKRLSHELEGVIFNEGGVVFEPATCEKLELKWLIKKIGVKLGVSIPKSLISQMAESLLKKGKRTYSCCGLKFFVTEGKLDIQALVPVELKN